MRYQSTKALHLLIQRIYYFYQSELEIYKTNLIESGQVFITIVIWTGTGLPVALQIAVTIRIAVTVCSQYPCRVFAVRLLNLLWLQYSKLLKVLKLCHYSRYYRNRFAFYLQCFCYRVARITFQIHSDNITIEYWCDQALRLNYLLL